MKNPLCIVLVLCSVLMACNRENPKSPDWRDRQARARLTGTEWQPYSAAGELRTSCDDSPNNREEALNLLVAADGDCLGKAVRAVGIHAGEDLDAAYLIRFERKGDPVDLLRALETAKGFNRALALEWLGLTKEAIEAWDAVAAEKSGWAAEARDNRKRLQDLPDPLSQWRPDRLEAAIKRRDTAAVEKIAHDFPADAARYFEKSDLLDIEGARLLAKALAATGEHYPQAVVEALERPRDRAALEEGLAAMRGKQYALADELLERAGNPLYLAARYHEFRLPALDSILPHLKPGYRELSARIHMSRASALEWESRYLDAHPAYERAIEAAKGDPTSLVATVGRRSVNYTALGSFERAFRDSHRAVRLLDRVADIDARHHAYGPAAKAVRRLGYPLIASHYQDAAVETSQRAVLDARGDAVRGAKHQLAVALRERADILVELGRYADAEHDLQQGADLAEAAAKDPGTRDLLRMRVHEVRGASLMKTDPAAAAAALTEAIKLAQEVDSSYRAVLHFTRAEAWRRLGDARHRGDLDRALAILREEALELVDPGHRGQHDELWTPYFSRFEARHRELIQSRIAEGDHEGAFVQAELARAFEPLQILLESRSVPAGFRPIETVADLQQARANLPGDTIILQYLVLPGKTYTWIVTRDGVELLQQRATKADIERRVADALEAVAAGQRDHFTAAMRWLYGELFRGPLGHPAASRKNRIVVVPDGPMDGLPLNGLVGLRHEGHLIRRASIVSSGSTSLYLYALARNRQWPAEPNPGVLLVGDPAFESEEFPPLPGAKEEVQELARDYYRGAEVLMDTEATVRNFLAKMKAATIVHVAGHALPNAESPWESRLLLAPANGESGELTARKLMQELPELTRTRLVVLGACSTAGGVPIGPQGLAPLVRPLIAANVPAVVASLWDVRDASAKELLVSFHCHYRHGDDVAVALRQAQLEMLRKNRHPMTWAAFQAVGYAASPYPPPVALEDPDIEHLCTQNSLLGPDGLRPQ